MPDSHPIKHIVDAAAAATTVGVIAGWLPAIAALFTIVWTGMQILEKITGKTLRQMIKGE